MNQENMTKVKSDEVAKMEETIINIVSFVYDASLEVAEAKSIIDAEIPLNSIKNGLGILYDLSKLGFYIKEE